MTGQNFPQIPQLGGNGPDHTLTQVADFHYVVGLVSARLAEMAMFS